MSCIITIERTLKDKTKLKKRLDISSPSRGIYIDEFLGEDDEFRIADAGMLQYFAQVNEHEGIEDLLELWHQVRANPYGVYFIYDHLIKHPEMLKPEERNRLSPSIVASRYNSLTYGFFRDKREVGINLFGWHLVNPRGKALKTAVQECFDVAKLMDYSVLHGAYGLAEFKDGKCITHDIPVDVQVYIDAWRVDPMTKRNRYPASAPLWGRDFVYVWMSGMKNDFYF